jgi:hypothetical protein
MPLAEELTNWKVKVGYLETAADQEQARQHQARRAIQDFTNRIKKLRDSRSEIKCATAATSSAVPR